MPKIVGEKVDYYRCLMDLVQSEQLRIISIISLPRSCGTIFARSLSQDSSIKGYAHEPFLPSEAIEWGKGEEDAPGFQRGSQYLLEYYTALRAQQPDGIITICTKDHSGEFTANNFRKLLQLTNNIIFTLRSPTHNIQSLLTSILNHLLTKSGGLPEEFVSMIIHGNLSLNEEEFAQLLGEEYGKISPTRLLNLAKKPEGATLEISDLLTIRKILLMRAKAFFGECWNKMPAFFLQAEHALNNEQLHSLQIMDHSAMMTDPEAALQQVCSQIPGLVYTSNMVHNMVKFGERDFMNFSGQSLGDEARLRQIWIGKTVTSLEIIPTIKPPLAVEDLPPELHDLVTQAIITYQDLLNRNSCIISPDLAAPAEEAPGPHA